MAVCLSGLTGPAAFNTVGEPAALCIIAFFVPSCREKKDLLETPISCSPKKWRKTPYFLLYVTQKVSKFITFEPEMDAIGNTRQNIGYLWPLPDW